MPKISNYADKLDSLPQALRTKNTYTAIPSIKANDVTASSKMNLDRLVVTPNDDYIIRLCMYSLPYLEDPIDVMRLFISTVASASGLSVSQLKSKNPDKIEGIDKAIEKYAQILANENSSRQEELEELQMPVPSWFPLQISASQFKDVMDVNSSEVYAYAGALCMAVTKVPTSENIEAFITKRANLATLGLMDDNASIFVPNSPYLTLETLGKISKATSYCMIPRELTMRAIANNLSQMDTGHQYVFACFFMLLENTGTNSLTIIRRVLKMYPKLPDAFPHWSMEVVACGDGIDKIMKLPQAERSFCKAIYGSKFVPVQYSDITHLLGICVRILTEFEPTMTNFKGGILSPSDEKIIKDLLDLDMKEKEEEMEEMP